MGELTHFDAEGRAHMVDVGEKPVTGREAVARGYVSMQPATLRRILDRTLEKGDVLTVAQIAGIMGAKRTGDLIPLCHPLSLSAVQVVLNPELEHDRIRIEATARTQDRTGVEMEALTAVSVAALTLYDMCKAIDRGMTIEGVCLLRKSGGRSGTWEREETP
jgi:cyclic pyranopterin phosphate synthase